MAVWKRLSVILFAPFERPAAAEGLLLMMLTAADLLMVSSLGTAAVAAVSIFSQPRMVIL